MESVGLAQLCPIGPTAARVTRYDPLVVLGERLGVKDLHAACFDMVFEGRKLRPMWELQLFATMRAQRSVEIVVVGAGHIYNDASGVICCVSKRVVSK